MATTVKPPVTPKVTKSVPALYNDDVPVKKVAKAPPPTLWQQALNQAKASYAAAAAPVQGQQAASDAYYKQRGVDATANAQALSDILAKLAPGVAAPYNEAAQTQGVLAKGFSQGMQDALNGDADKSNDLLKQLNSPAQIDPHAQQSGDVLYALGGYIPGGDFAKTGAAYGAAAALQPGIALRQGAENVQAASVSGAAAHADFDSKIATLAGQIPGDAETNYQKLQALALDNKKFALAVSKEKFDEAAKIASQKLQIAKYKSDVQYKNASLNLRGQSLNLQAQKFSREQFQQDREYGLAVTRLGISQKSLQLRIAANAFKQANGGYTTSQIGRFNQKLDALVASSGGLTRPANGVMPAPQFQDKNGKWHDITPATPAPSNSKTRGTATYGNFIVAALKKGVPIQLAIQRADSLYPETQRALPPSLQNLPALASEAAKQRADYNQTTGVTLGTSPKGVPITWDAPSNLRPAVKAKVGSILGLANEYLGTPYAWGGESPTGFDCSGLAQYIYGKVGISIPRTTYDQFQGGLAVPKGQLQPGDLVFFKGSDSKGGLPGHVGIYVGGGKMIQAPHTGDVVKVSSVSGFPGYAGARRYVH